MRHKRGLRNLNKPTEERMAMLYAQTGALFEHEKIRLTVARAKEVRRIAEKLISKAKGGELHQLRAIASVLKTKDAVKKVCKLAQGRFEGRAGGFTRMTKIGARRGDNAPLALLELV